MDKCQADELQYDRRKAAEAMAAAGDQLAQTLPLFVAALQPVIQAFADAAVPLGEALRRLQEAGQLPQPSGEEGGP